jgi:hypothetical protein
MNASTRRAPGACLLVFAVLYLLAHGAAPGADDAAPPAGAGAVQERWQTFCTHLRSGQMQAAYACFNEPSRAAMPFPEFLWTYSPLSAVGEAVQSPMLEATTRLGDGTAVVRFLARTGTRGGAMVEAFLVHEIEGWRLVSEALWPRAVREAGALELLRRMHAYLDDLAARGRFPTRFDRFAEEHPAITKTPLWERVREDYVVSLVPVSAGNWRIYARPRGEGATLRAFTVDAKGILVELSPGDAPEATP